MLIETILFCILTSLIGIAIGLVLRGDSDSEIA
jgi:hypothetical protein